MNLIIRNDMELAAAKQLSIDLSCTPQDFFKNENTVTVPAIRRGRRVFSDMPYFFRAATMGMGAVICASPDIAEYTRVLAANTAGTEIFTASVISALNRELFSHGYCIGLLNQYYVPAVPYRHSVRNEGFTLRVFDQNNIDELFGYKGFDNALLYRTEGERRDIIAVCAFNSRRIMGMAGASSDSPTMAQIGIDVLPEFRGMGVGAALVAACTAEVLRSGYVPYYGTWSGNIISQRIAAKCGYRPAWCEMTSAAL